MSFPLSKPLLFFLYLNLFLLINSNNDFNDETDLNYGKVDIFICTHQPFNCPVTNKHYKILPTVTGLLNNESYQLDIIPADVNNTLAPFEHSYSELYNMNYIFESYELKKFVGFVQYKKYFSFFNTIPNLDEVFENHDAILPAPIYLKEGVEENYNYYHNLEDLKELGEIIQKNFPEYNQTYNRMVKGNVLIPWNMFIMKSEDFIKFFEFQKNVLNIYNLRHNFTSDKDTMYYIIDTWDRVYKNKEFKGTPQWQQKIHCFLSERIGTMYYWQNFKNPLYFEMIVPGDDFRAGDIGVGSLGLESINGIEGVNLNVNINRTYFNKEKDDKEMYVFDDKFTAFVIFMLLMGKIMVRTNLAKEEEAKKNKAKKGKNKSKNDEKIKIIEKKKFMTETSELV